MSTKKRKWWYSGDGARYGLMICSVCRNAIESGEFRVHEHPDRYEVQHKGCSLQDPHWGRIEQERARQADFHARRKKAYENFVKEFGTPEDLFEENE